MKPKASESLVRALAELTPDKLAKSRAARGRYERRQARLQRRQLELQQKRSQALLDPLARAMAKAKALADNDDS